MPHLVPKIYIKKLAWLARSGAYFKSCARYSTDQGIRYNYKLYNKEGQQVKCQATGPRKLLSFNFPTKGFDGKRHRLDIHQLWAFSSPVLNPGLGHNPAWPGLAWPGLALRSLIRGPRLGCFFIPKGPSMSKFELSNRKFFFPGSSHCNSQSPGFSG